MAPRVAIFGPNPLLTVAIERRGGTDDVHLHVGGQGVWVARMAGELGAEPVLCGFQGGESGAILGRLLDGLPGERRLVPTAGASGCYVTDRRSGEREVLAAALAPSALAPRGRRPVLGRGRRGGSRPMFSWSQPVPARRAAARAVRQARGRCARGWHPGAGRPLVAAPGQRARGPARPGQAQRLGAGRVRGAARSTARAARGRRAPARCGSRRGDRHARRRAGVGARRRQRVGAGAAAFRAGLARRLRRLDDGRARGGWAPGCDFEDERRRAAAAGAANFLRHGLGRARARWSRS